MSWAALHAPVIDLCHLAFDQIKPRAALVTLNNDAFCIGTERIVVGVYWLTADAWKNKTIAHLLLQIGNFCRQIKLNHVRRQVFGWAHNALRIA